MQPTLSPEEEELNKLYGDLDKDTNSEIDATDLEDHRGQEQFMHEAQAGIDDIPTINPEDRSNNPGDGEEASTPTAAVPPVATASDGSPLPGGASPSAAAAKRADESSAYNPYGGAGAGGVSMPKKKTTAYQKYKKYKLVKNTAKAALGSRKAIFGLLFSGSIIGLLIGAFFLLAPFKLMFMKENIDEVRMARMHHILDRRSDRFLVTLLKAEIAGQDAGGQNRYFMAKGWVGSEHPFTQWYRDMRTGKFFDEMERTQGVRFIRELDVATGKDRLVKLSMHGEVIDFSDLTKDGGMVFDDTERFERLVETRFTSNKEGRRAFNAAVKQATQRHQIIKRYNMRKWGYERLGITKWRFFENTREKADEKVRQSWNRAVGRASMGGRAIKCLFKIGPCPRSDSLNDPENAPGPPDPELEQISEEAESEAQQNPNPENSNDPSKTTRIFAKKVVLKLIPFVNIAESIDLLKHIHKIFKDKVLSKMVSTFRAAEFATAYFTFSTLTDNLKDGKVVSGQEAGAALSMFDGIEHSEGYQQVTGGTKTALFPSPPKAYAADEEPFDRVGDTMQVNNGSSRASKIEAFYEKTFGKVIGPILAACEFGPISLCDVASGVTSVLGDALGFLLKPVTAAATGIFTAASGKTPDEALMSVMADATVFLAGSSNCPADASGGRKFNCIDGGASVVHEGLLQNLGAGPATDSAIREMNDTIAAEKAEEDTHRSLWSKVASLERSDSLVARLVLATPASSQELAHSFQNLLAYINPVTLFDAGAGSIASLSSKPSYADVLDDNLYGVKRHAVSEADLAKEPYGSKSTAECEQEMAEYKAAMEAGGDPPTSMCTLDKEVANSLACYNNDDPNCAKIDGEEQSEEACTGPSGAAPSATGGGDKKAFFLGDSIMVGAKQTDLAAKAQAAGFNATIDAVGSRSMTSPGVGASSGDGIEAVDANATAIQEASIVVIILGANGSGSEEQFAAQLNQLIGKVKALNDKAPIYWVRIFSQVPQKGAYNTVIDKAEQDKKLVAVKTDGKGIALSSDGVHPTGDGYAKLVGVLADTLARSASGATSCAGAGELVSGSDQALAEEILNNPNIKLIGTNAKADMEAAKQGRVGPSGVKINSTLLQIIATMGKNHKFNISSMLRPSDSDSAHSTGEAIDITGLDGNPIANSGLGRTPNDIRLMKEISPLLPKPSGWGQIRCGPAVQLPRGIDQFVDSCDHLHLEINH